MVITDKLVIIRAINGRATLTWNPFFLDLKACIYKIYTVNDFTDFYLLLYVSVRTKDDTPVFSPGWPMS